jgi:hypothetical protein
MLVDDGVRLPGSRRESLLRVAEANGIRIADSLLASLEA